MNSKVTDLALYRQAATATATPVDGCQETIDVCKDIISRAERGICTGMVYCIRQDGENHAAGATGDYKIYPAEVCIIAGALLNAYSEAAGFNVNVM